ncbi:MAG: hypothetical protein LAP85_27125 [Acidobacteriia bacterium]|nr:hypothetical protein [Terriglobia bacterium]
MKKIAMFTFFLLIVGTGSAMADIVKIGPPQLTGSWAQHWSENGILGGIIQPYNKVVITMNTGVLEYLTAETAGWSVAAASMLFQGSHSGQFDFVTTFEGYWSNAVSFNYQVYFNDTLLSTQVADWDPASGWSYQFPQNCLRPMPEPDLLVLLLCGLAFVTIVAFRKP